MVQELSAFLNKPPPAGSELKIAARNRALAILKTVQQ